MMGMVIAIIKNSRKHRVGFRLLDTSNGKVYNAKEGLLLSKINELGITNFSDIIGELKENNSEDDRYPVIDTAGKLIKNNRIVIIDKSTDGYRVTDYTGRIRDVSEKLVEDCDKSKISNLKYLESLKNESMDIQLSDALVKSKLKTILNKENMEFIADTDLEKIKAEGNLGIAVTRKDIKTPTMGEDEYSKPEALEINESDTKTAKLDTGGYEVIIENIGGKKTVTGIKPKDFTGVVTIPFGVQNLAKYSFADSNISGLILPESLEFLGESCLSGTSVTEITLPSKISTIPHYCFYKSAIKKVNLDRIATLGNYAFSESLLEEAVFKAEITQFGVSAFEGCKELHKVEHPDTLKKIRSRSLSSCQKVTQFDFTGVSEIEDMAFYDTGLVDIHIKEDMTYVKSRTFVGAGIVSIEFNEGTYKLADDCILNSAGLPITFTLPRSISNIGTNVIMEKDTVRCYRNSVADTAANLYKCKIEYLDESTIQPSTNILKAGMMGINIKDMIEKSIETAYSKEDAEYDFEVDESQLVKIELNVELLKFLELDDVPTPVNYEERPKFKCLIQHLQKTGTMSGVGLTTIMCKLRSTFSIAKREIYSDGISRLYEFKYSDHKYESLSGKYLVAITGNTVRYCGLNNKYTDILCRRPESKDLHKLIDTLTVGDAIGYDCIINGVKYDHIAAKSDKPIKDSRYETFTVNIYQALFECCIAVKLEKNFIALILPVNNKVIKCVSLGKSVWANETEDGFKVKQCIIDDIQDLDTNTIFEYGAKTPNRDAAIFNKLGKFNGRQVEKRLEEYAEILPATRSTLIYFRNYILQEDIDNTDKLDLRAVNYMMSFPTIEKRNIDWLNKFKGKTIIPTARPRYDLKDGTVILQYQTVKRVAMRNKLITGGDRTIYLFEVIDNKHRLKNVYASTMDMESLFEQGSSMKLDKYGTGDRIFTNTARFDMLNKDKFIKVVPAFVGGKNQAERAAACIWLCIYKPNGLYYICYIHRLSRIVPLIQVGEFDVLLDYIDCANTGTASGADTLNEAGYTEIARQLNGNMRYGKAYHGKFNAYEAFLEARRLAIEGVTDVSKYFATGISPVLCHMMGVQEQSDELYSIPKKGETWVEQQCIKYDDVEDIEISELEDIAEEVNKEVQVEDSDDIDIGDEEIDLNIDIDEEDIYGTEDGISEEDISLEQALAIQKMIEENREK